LFKKGFPWSKNEQKELPNVDVVGEFIRLREKRIDDIPDEYSWRVDDELSRLDATRPLTMSYDDFFRYTKEEMQFPSYRSKRLAIDTLDGVHIGNVMYYDLNVRNREAELGIMIGDKGYWGKGYGTDIVKTLLTHLFLDIALDRVYLHTLAWNYRAQASFEKAGFKKVRSVRRGGQEFLLMEVVGTEWRNEVGGEVDDTSRTS
jgi:RimJ/RimL family protein N-acetyltransferase